MTRMLMIAAIFGLAIATSACTQSTQSAQSRPPAVLAESQPVVMRDVPELSGSSIPEPISRPIDFQDSRTYGNNGGT